MQIDYDYEADALYIRFREAEIEHTVEVDRYILVDVDVNDTPVGLELLFAGQISGRQGMTGITFNTMQRSTLQ